MVKYNSKDLTLKDIERIDKHGADYVSRKYNIDYSLAKTCEMKLNQTQTGGNNSYNGKRNLRKYKEGDSSDSIGMRELLESSSEEKGEEQPTMPGMMTPYQMQGVQSMHDMMSPQGMMSPQMQGMQLQNPYFHNVNMSETLAANVNPMTNQEHPNISLTGNALQPINNTDVVNNIINNPNPNIFQMNQSTSATALPPNNERMDPLMVNQMVPVISQQEMLGNLKQLNAI